MNSVSIENYFKKNGIPYTKNAKVSDSRERFDFVIPGGIIKIRTGKMDGSNEKPFYTLENQLKNTLDIIPDNFNIWLITTPDNVNVEMVEDLISFSDRVHWVKSLEDIKILNYTVNVYHEGYIRSLASTLNIDFENDVKFYSGKLVTTQEIYDKAITMLTDTEMEKLNKFKFNIGSKNHYKPGNIRIKFKKNIISSSRSLRDILECFYITKRIYGLEMTNGPRILIREIEGISTKCSGCSNIFYNSKTERHLRGCNTKIVA